MFSLLNLVSGFLETGAIIFALRHFDVNVALVAAILYQFGNLVPHPIQLSKQTTSIFTVFYAILILGSLYFPLLGIIATPFLLGALQSVRSGMKTDSGKMRKRSFRMLGFLLGFLFNVYLGLLCAAITLAAVILASQSSENNINIPRFKKLQVVMMLHQTHYFVYCYAVMLIAYQQGGALVAAGLFFAGWLTYVFAPLAWKKGKNYRKMFLLGHSVLTIILLSIFFVPSLYAKVASWLLTGLGGTTEYCIGQLEKQTGNYHELNHNCAENFGHILGVVICLGACLVTADLYISVLLAAIFALCAIMLMATVKNKGEV